MVGYERRNQNRPRPSFPPVGFTAVPPDLPALPERLNLLQVVRAVIGCVSVGLAVAIPGRFAVGPATAATAAVLLLITTASAEHLRRRRLVGENAARRVLLAIDAVFLAVTTAWSGQAASPLLPFAVVHLVAVTILLSWRGGAEALAFDVVAFSGAAAAVSAGLIPSTEPPANVVSLGAILLAFAATTALTAACSSYDQRALRQSRRHFRALSELALRLEAVSGSAAISDVLAEHLGRRLGFSRVAVLLPNRRGTTVVSWSPAGLNRRDISGPLTGDAMVRSSLKAHRPVVRGAGDIDLDGSLVAAALPGAAQTAVMAMRTGVLDLGGAIAVEWSRPETFPPGTADVLRLAAAHGAAALRNSRLLAELERRAARDPLTGLANRRALDDSLDRELSRARRDGASLSLVLLDIDHFKAINDERGHLVGDEVLSTVARTLAETVRDMDLVARYGGEEFVVLLPATALEDAVGTAERLRLAVSGQQAAAPVTVSAGVATFPDQAPSGAELLVLADRALYEAKRAGRDRVVAAAGDRADRGPRPAPATAGVAPSRRSA
jgi:two-component system cell cycle response regulator